MANRFLIPLTFPNSEWSAEDFWQTDYRGRKKNSSKKFLPNIYLSEDSLVPIDFLPRVFTKQCFKKIIEEKL